MKEKSPRTGKVAGEIKKVLSESLIRGEIGFCDDLVDPRMIVITDVEVSSCLRHAKIFVSSMISDNGEEKYLEFLEKHSSQLRKVIAQNLKLKFVPEIRFFIDSSSAYASRIENILKSTH